jgi:hypothetical protein
MYVNNNNTYIARFSTSLGGNASFTNTGGVMDSNGYWSGVSITSWLVSNSGTPLSAFKYNLEFLYIFRL